MTTGSSPPPLPRLLFIDWLRLAAFGLLVPYHVGMLYVGWDWHVKHPVLHPGLEPLMQLLNPWRLGLLFVVAGVACAGLWQRGPGFVGERSRRLLLPLLFGVLVVVPPQAWWEVQHKLAHAGGYLDFWRLYLQGDARFCRGSACLVLPTWNHLWFVAYLWVYLLVGWVWLKAWPDTPACVTTWLRRHASRRTLLFTLALPLVLSRLLVGRFPSTHNLVHDVYNHAQYLPLFLLGWWAAGSGLWDQAARHRWLALGLAVASWLLVVAYFDHGRPHGTPETLRWLQRAWYGAMQWWCLVAVLGWARHLLDHDHRWRPSLTRGVFCVYILHQTVIIGLAVALRPLQLTAAVEGPLIIAATFVLCGLACAVARHVPGLRQALGISPAPPAGRAAGPQPGT